MAFDLDECFEHRLPLLARSIEAHGLLDASIATSGSDSGRGKVIVFFKKPRNPNGLRALANAIAHYAGRGSKAWGIETSARFTIFPTGGEGGSLRIGGRNSDPARAAITIEQLFSVYGEPRTFAEILPATIARHPIPDPAPLKAARLPAYIDDAIREGVRRHNHRYILNFRLRLACDVIAHHGGPSELACAHFEKLENDIRSASPALLTPSPTTADQRHPFDRTGDAFAVAAAQWQRSQKRYITNGQPDTPAQSYITNVVPQSPKGLGIVTTQRRSSDETDRRTLAALWEWRTRYNLPSDGFSVSLRSLARIAGIASAIQVQRAINRLATNGKLVVHDNGAPGERGLSAQYGLVDDERGETPDIIRQRGAMRHSIRVRPMLKARHQEERRLAKEGRLAKLPTPRRQLTEPSAPTEGDRPTSLRESLADFQIASRAKYQ